VVFQFRGLFGAARVGGDADPRSLVLRALETVEDVDAHLHLTEVLVRALAQLDGEEGSGPIRAVP
jgi:hypothetical protein